MIREQVFTYGEHQHGIGVLSEPDNPEANAPIVVLLNAGLSHRAEPYRLNVLLARALAQSGYIALRVDLAGKGDSPARPGLTNRDSVALDWSFISKALEKQYGARTMLIFGLCSGADNGIKLSAQDPRIKGLILLDPVSRPDPGFRKRDFLRKITNPNKWMRLHKILARKLGGGKKAGDSLLGSPMDLRDEPNSEDMDQCFQGMLDRDGRVLAVFTSQALYHYNKQGQFAEAMAIGGLGGIVDEVFWPNAKHIFPIESHRTRLIETVAAWAGQHVDHFKSLTPV